MAAAPAHIVDLIGFGPQGWGSRFLHGTLLTVEISVGGYAVGIALGLAGVWAKLSRRPVWKRLAGVYTTLVRAVPELLLIILLYYSGTSALDSLLARLGLSESFDINPFAAAVATLGFVQGAYLTEVFRGATLSIPEGLFEAGRALGLRPLQRFRLVILPLALRRALPGMSNLWLSILKDSSLISVVGFSELLFTGRQAAGATKFYFSFFLFTAVLFLLLTAVSNIGIHLVRRVVGAADERA